MTKHFIAQLNSEQEGYVRGRIELNDIHFPWEDSGLLETLTKPISREYERYGASNKDDERSAVAIANEVIDKINDGKVASDEIEKLRSSIEQSNGYLAHRLQSILWRLSDHVEKNTGLLIFGEGGIGKTYFLYELIQELKKGDRNYLAAFNGKAIRSIADCGIQTISKATEGQFVLVIDGFNELSDNECQIAYQLIEDVQALPFASIIVSTRSNSPDSRLDKLRSLFRHSIQFEGVDGYAAFEALAGCPSSIYAQYQSFLLSHNPRTIKAIAYAIQKKIDGNPDEKTALIQRTTIVEDAIKRSLGVDAWANTKKICEHLYATKRSFFSRQEANDLLGSSTEQYLQNAVQNGLIYEYSDGDDLSYHFASESQLQWLIARSVNDDLRSISFCGDTIDTAKRVAEVISNNSTYLTVHEMCQAAMDKYVNQGPAVFKALAIAFWEADLDFDFYRIITDTVFPDDYDFSILTSNAKITAGQALLHFGGFSNKPFNLTNFANNILVNNPLELDRFYIENWTPFDLSELVLRVKNISEFVARMEVIPDEAREEWLWLSVWTSWSPELRVRSWAQRLMFVLCDKSMWCTKEILEIWNKVPDIYVRRAISNTIRHLSVSKRNSPEIGAFLENILGDPSLCDSITISYLIEATEQKASFSDFSSRDYYGQNLNNHLSQEKFELARSMIWTCDLLFKDFLPLDIYRLNNGVIDFDGLGRFFDTPKNEVRSWNGELTSRLHCTPGGKCKGWMRLDKRIESFLPIPFDRKPLDNNALCCALVFLLENRFQVHGGTLQETLGEFKSGYRAEAIRTPNMKVLDEALHILLGSIAANYFTDELSLCAGKQCLCGFREYEESCWHEPTAIHLRMPATNSTIERAKKQLETRFENPIKKERAWFDNHEGIQEELVGLVSPVIIKKQSWKPLALSAREKIHDSDPDRRFRADLQYSNEYIISVTFNSNDHLYGVREDRMLTIEHGEYAGNIADYGKDDNGFCLWLPSPDTDKDDPHTHQILMPPQTIVSELGLTYVPKEGVFVDSDGHIAAICDGGYENYYEDTICNLVLLREDLFDKLSKRGDVRYFAFSERFHHETGYANGSDLHWELNADGVVLASFPNGSTESLETIPNNCATCYFGDQWTDDANCDDELESFINLCDEYIEA